MAHFADFDGAKIDSRNNLLKMALPFYPQTIDKMIDMN